MLRHSVTDMSQVMADVGKVRACGQQLGGQRVPGLVRDVPAEVEADDPGSEAGAELSVGDGPFSRGVADIAGKQCEAWAFFGGGQAAAEVLEPRQGLVAPGFQPLVKVCGDPDTFVVVTDLGLVVPEHGQAAVAT